MLVEGKNFKERILNSFELYENHLNGQKDSKLHKIRLDAIEKFKELGLPTLKNELWKYTNVGFLNSFDIRVDINEPETEITKEDIKDFRIEGLDNAVVLVNGFFVEKLSDYDSDLEIKSLRDAFNENKDDIEKHFNKYLKIDKNVFSSINTALAFDGAFIKSKKNQIEEDPIHIINIIDTNSGNQFKQARNLFIAERSSNFSIVETNHTLGDNIGIMNIGTELFIDENADITHLKFQNDSEKSVYFSQTEAMQKRDSNYTNHTISLGGRFVRNDLGTVQNDENINSNYFGYFHINGRNFVDNHTMVDHAMPNCTSNELYKGILDDASTGVFNGKILVRQDAQKIDAYQSSKNTLLSDNAKVNAKPELEIYADDVKCSHGSSTGTLDKEALFYLQSRGIEEKQAKALLMLAYAQEVIDKIKIDPVREHITKIVQEKLGM